MNSNWKLLPAALLVAVLAVAGCGGGGDDTMTTPDPMPTPDPDPAIAERAMIDTAIMAARAAVPGIDNDSTDTEVSAAEMAVASARAAIAAADNVPAAEKAAHTTTVNALEAQLDAAKTARMMANDEADEAAAEAMAALGKALHAALAGPDPATQNALNNLEAVPALSATGLSVDAAAGAGTIDDATAHEAVALEAGDSAGSHGGWSARDYADSDGNNEARVYSNAAAPTSQPFAEKYPESDANVTDGVLTVADSDAARALVMADAFTHQGTQTHVVPDRSDAVYVRGTYDGAPGEYSCTATCSSTNDGSGSPNGLGGTWTFTPDTGAMVSQPDDEYLYYGWWVRKDSDGNPTAASAFAGVVEPNAGDLDNGGDLTTITGSASYAGNAAGKYAIDNVLEGTGHGGHFTADAELEATFGAGATAGVTGTIDNFRLNDGSEDPGWSVALARGGIGAAGAISAPAADPTVWSINGNEAPASGTWSGTMYDEMPGVAPDGDGSNIPTTVTGTFYSEFSTIGRMVGAFGADKQ